MSGLDERFTREDDELTTCAFASRITSQGDPGDQGDFISQEFREVRENGSVFASLISLICEA
jgi:hypothetical protein